MFGTLFSFSGRMSPRQFGLATIPASAMLLLPNALLFFCIFHAPKLVPGAMAPLFPLVTFMGFFSWAAIIVKRVRDAWVGGPPPFQQRQMPPSGGFARLRSFLSFSGRMSRAEYRRANIVLWSMVLVPTALFQACGAVTHSIPVIEVAFAAGALSTFTAGFGMLAVNTRRMHDLGGSAFSLLLGPFALLALLFREGEPYDNAYGPPPLAQ